MVDRDFPAIDLTQYIEKRHYGERPHLRSRRLHVWVVAHAVIDNKNIGLKELMYAYDLSEQEVLATLLYYTHHQDEIEMLEEAENEKYRHIYG